jgi:hypothetical protein
MPSNNHALAEPTNWTELYPHVRRATFPPELTYETMSPLGKELYELSMEYEASGERLFTEDELEQEIAYRKGGHVLEETDNQVVKTYADLR